MERKIEDIMPIMDIEHDCIVSKLGDITIAFRVELPEIFTLSDDDLEALQQDFLKTVKVLPKNSVLHKQDWYRSRKYQPGPPLLFIYVLTIDEERAELSLKAQLKVTDWDSRTK